MTVRERLIEILRKPIFPHELADPTEAVADYLLDNGVTIQRWIPVTERLPDGQWRVPCIVLIKDRKESAVRFFHRATVRKKTVERFEYPWGRISDEEITHWMPLPKAPGKEVNGNG